MALKTQFIELRTKYWIMVSINAQINIVFILDYKATLAASKSNGKRLLLTVIFRTEVFLFFFSCAVYFLSEVTPK